MPRVGYFYASSGFQGDSVPTNSYRPDCLGMQALMTAEREQWLARFAAEMRVAAPTAQEIDAILALAGLAAHTSERTAAPLSAWIAGRSGVDIAVALSKVEQLSQEFAQHEDGSRDESK